MLLTCRPVLVLAVLSATCLGQTVEDALARLREARPGDPDVLLASAESIEDLWRRLDEDPRPIVAAKLVLRLSSSEDEGGLARAAGRWKVIEADNAWPWVLAAWLRFESGDMAGGLRELAAAPTGRGIDLRELDVLRLHYRLAREGGVELPSRLYPLIDVPVPWSIVLEAFSVPIVLAEWRSIRGEPGALEILERLDAIRIDRPTANGMRFLVHGAIARRTTGALFRDHLLSGRVDAARASLGRFETTAILSARFSRHVDALSGFPYDGANGLLPDPLHLDSKPDEGRAYVEDLVSGAEPAWASDPSPVEIEPSERWPERIWDHREILTGSGWTTRRVDGLVRIVAGEVPSGDDCYALQELAARVLLSTPEALHDHLGYVLGATDAYPARWLRSALDLPGRRLDLDGGVPLGTECVHALVRDRPQGLREALVDALDEATLLQDRVLYWLALRELTGEDRPMDPAAWR